METVNSTSERLTRHACEPCRRKKIKCTAERPICSYCKRLGDQCHYLPRGRPGSMTGRSRQRVAMAMRTTGTHTVIDSTELLSQTNRAANSGAVKYPDQLSHNTTSSAAQHQPSSNSQSWGSSSVQDVFDPPIFSTSRPDPGLLVLQHFVDIYQTKIHLQPLPLFFEPDLAEKLNSGPHYLLWSFMSLMLHFSSHDFFHCQESTAASFYSHKAEQAVAEIACEGIPTIELAQALCLITLKHFKTRQLGRAWMTAGTALRLEATRLLSCESLSASRDPSHIRTCWLVNVLECLLVPLIADNSCLQTPDYPDLTLIPPLPRSSDAQESAKNVQHRPGQSPTDSDRVSIIAHSLRIITIWGELRSYLHKLRQGKTEKPWSPDSAHTRINLELIAFESNTPERLFLCNAYLSSRTRDEVSQHPEYWNRFMVGQIMWHAIHAILNHPFIHLSLLTSRDSIPPSCFFLQQRIDMAIYHCNWTFRLLEMFNNLMDIVDPMIADIIACTATVSWLFQFSKNHKIAQDAQSNLVKCEEFLSQVAQIWPHISYKVDVLGKLRALARENYRQNSSHSTTISFQPAWFWDLLAPKPSLKTNTTRIPDLRGETKSEISLKSHFVLPLDDDTNPNVDPAPVGFDFDPFFVMPGELGLFNIDSLSHDFLQNDPWGQGC